MNRLLVLTILVVCVVLLAGGTLAAQQITKPAKGAEILVVQNPVVAGINGAAEDGVDPLDQAAPPPPPNNYLYAYFLLDPGSSLPNYSVDIKKDDASLITTAKVWDLRAVSDVAGPMTLNLPFASGLPAGVPAVLHDLSADVYQNLRVNPNYAYTSVASVTKQFQVLIGDQTPPSVAVTYPNGGELLTAGTPITITWTSADASGLLAHDVYYDNGGGYTLITSVSGATNSLLWTPPAGTTAGRIKVVARDHMFNEQEDASDATFGVGYTLTVTSANGTVVKNPVKTTYTVGEVVELTATAAAGWSFANWTGDATGTANPVSVTMNGHKNVTANYTQDEYTLAITSAHGTVVKSPNQTTYHYGDVVQLTATADAGWTFANWTGDATGTANPVSVTMNGNRSVTANYTQIEYTLAITSAHGTVAKSPNQATYHYGDVVQLTATADAGWTFANWTGDATGTSNPVSVTMNGNRSVTANYTQIEYTLAITSAHGTVVKSPNLATYHYGDVVQLTATADAGWTFANWTGDATGSSNPVSVTMNGDRSVTANYTQIEYTLAITSTHGTVAKSPNQATYHYGDVVQLTATADAGWSFANWTGDATGSSNPVSVTMNGNRSVTANYTQIEYTLAITSTHGTVVKSPNQATYHYGDVVQLTATADAGWSFANWTGDATGSSNPVSVTMNGNRSVTANYTQIEYTLAITSAHGTVAKSPNQATYHYGDVVQLTATADAGWSFANWTGDATGTANPVSVTMNGDRNVTANYDLTIVTVSTNAPAGWNLVSVPVLQPIMTPADVFGDDYTPLTEPYYTFQYAASTGYTVPTTLNMGQGYWLGSNFPKTVDATGLPVSSATLLLADGFNIIGNPFVAAEPLINVRFTDGSIIKTFAEAVSASWVSSGGYFKYNGIGYDPEATALGIWQGYWLATLRTGISIQYTPGPGASPSTRPVEAAVEPATASHWSVDVAATYLTDDGKKSSDAIASFGVRDDASAGFDNRYDAPRPPRSPNPQYVEVSFVVGGESFPQQFGSSYARDFRSSEKPVWQFVVNTSGKGKVTLTWDRNSIAALGGDVKVDLYDETSNRMVDMKSASSYTYEQTGTSRRFIVNKLTQEIPASFQLAQNYPNPFNPQTTISYGLPSAAAVSIEVFNFLGQRVATLASGDAVQSAGYHEVVFNGSGIASGVYYYTINARGDNGGVFTAVKKMVLIK